MFKKASKLKLRFNTDRGVLTVEDLWDLDLESLDILFKDLNKSLKETDEESLLTVKTTANTKLQLKVNIIKDVVSDKLADVERRESEAELKERRKLLLGVKAERQKETLLGMSEEDIDKELEKMK